MKDEEEAIGLAITIGTNVATCAVRSAVCCCLCSRAMKTPTSRMEVDLNRNTQWIHRRGMKRFYIFLLAAVFFLGRVAGFNQAISATITVQLHCFITFVCFHWMKGMPETTAVDSDVEHLTWWEQLDSGYLHTPTRRFLSIVPAALFLLSIVATQNDMILLLVNAISTTIVLVPKHSALFGVRLFGINKLE